MNQVDIVEIFYRNKSEENALPMSAYMKNQFPFLGLKRPKRNELQKAFIKEAKKKKEIDWDFVFKCWALPEREFQYLAADYLVAMKDYMLDTEIEKIEKLIVTKSWWDAADILAPKVVGELCSKYPYLIEEYIMKWCINDNIWLRRTSLLFQLKYKEKTDTELLEKIILENKDTKEFFVNKAIGWILREFSKTNKEWVKSFIDNNTLHPLSAKEGSKYL
ncbi:DNA alkylation repair protein [Clostridium sp. A1-XYC3]|uniref:DNA alkylation repair protein n=1 Tax=Clostridium tanneri TaxID=3037988 RepID=A0ABU4JWL3_9CLOT|nr:DNA alkylation repair protein [Clostridium sp. A1-XYC3]MDW8802497.1 DNA alkylation repair protein [Clostridium sp. A1-XYC3]